MTRIKLKGLIKEADVVPTDPTGNKISDPTVIRNLNMAVKAVSSAIRPKLLQLIEDPAAAKELKSPAQRAAVVGAIAIAFGISEKEFAQIVTKIKGMLNKAEPVETTPGTPSKTFPVT